MRVECFSKMAEVPRNRLPSGYDEDFVNEVEEDFNCLICHLPLKEPIQTRCGHRFCKECLEEHFTRQRAQDQPLTCPVDREGLDDDRDVFPDKATERKILSFSIKCPSEGCEWTGELRNKEVHLGSCLFKLVPCTNENCHVTVQRKAHEEHVTITCQWKIINCDYCSEPHPECKIKDHIVQCSKLPVMCPNNCGASFPRDQITDHTKDNCPLTFISCPYEQMGCVLRVQRKNVESHLRSDVIFHVDLACAKLKNTEVKLHQTEAKLKDTELKLNETQKNLEVTRKRVEELDTRVFIWKINDFSEVLRQAKTEGKNKIESVPFYVAKPESYGYKLKVKLYPNGSGSDKNTHLSVFINVMKGEYDVILPWPLSKKVKFTLIDQQEDPAQWENVARELISQKFPHIFSRPTTEENKGRGFPDFISHETLYLRRYLVDDSLFLQVELAPSSD